MMKVNEIVIVEIDVKSFNQISPLQATEGQDCSAAEQRGDLALAVVTKCL